MTTIAQIITDEIADKIQPIAQANQIILYRQQAFNHVAAAYIWTLGLETHPQSHVIEFYFQRAQSNLLTICVLPQDIIMCGRPPIYTRSRKSLHQQDSIEQTIEQTIKIIELHSTYFDNGT